MQNRINTLQKLKKNPYLPNCLIINNVKAFILAIYYNIVLCLIKNLYDSSFRKSTDNQMASSTTVMPKLPALPSPSNKHAVRKRK